LVGVLFAVLALTVPRSFFDDHGAVVGPLAWIVCSLVTGRILRVPLGRLAIASAAGGVAAGVIGLLASHLLSLPVAIAVFAAVCAAEPRRGTDRPPRSAAERA
jgi:hypothetical protein